MSTDTPAARRQALAEFVARFTTELEPLSLEHNEAVWQTNVTGSAEAEARSAALEAKIRLMYARPEPYAFLNGIAAAGGVDDPQLQRQLVLLLNGHRANQIPPAVIERMVALEKALERKFNHFRAELDGERVTDNALRDVLRASDDGPRRRRAWEASKQIGAEVVEDLLALVRLRNDAARGVGFPNHYGMMLALDEIDEQELYALLDEVERGTAEPFRRYKSTLDRALATRFAVPPPDLRPWHYADPFFQEAPAADVSLDRWFEQRSLEDITARFYAAIGFDLTDLLARADLYEKPGKSQHAFCLSVDHGNDVRVLCNVRPNEYWMGTMLHEFGHAVYDVSVDRALPFALRRPAHIMTTEASAMLFGRLSRNAAWLERWAGVPRDEASAIAAACARATRAQLLVQTRWMLVMCHMERALYADPGQDLDTLWWDLVERFQGVRRPDDRRAPDWASKIHFSLAPVYYHNYQLGEMTASQLQRHLLEHVVSGNGDRTTRYVESPEVGAWLRDRVYRSGRSFDWRETLRRATGRPLDPSAFIADLEEPAPAS